MTFLFQVLMLATSDYRSLRAIFYLVFLVFFCSCHSLKITQVYNGFSTEGTHSRGIDINGAEELLYVSGVNGKVSIFDLNTKKIIDTFSLPANDFRAVQHCSDGTLLLMNSGDNGLVYKYDFKSGTADTVLFVQNVFFDAMCIDSSGNGILMGDPIEGHFEIYLTEDFGTSWVKIDEILMPKALPNEAGFAASNTGINQIGNTIYIATGASDISRLLITDDGGKSWTGRITPMKSGKSFGIYSSCFTTDKFGVIAGGSYQQKDDNDSIVFLTRDGGITWQNISKGLPGYVSCIQYDNQLKLMVATGRLGVFYSTNDGKKWCKITSQPFYSVLISGKNIILSGQSGTLSIYTIN